MLAGGVGAGAVVVAGVVVDGFRSLHAPSESATSAAAIGTANLFIWSPLLRSRIYPVGSMLSRLSLVTTHIFQAWRAVNKIREPCNRH